MNHTEILKLRNIMTEITNLTDELNKQVET